MLHHAVGNGVDTCPAATAAQLSAAPVRCHVTCRLSRATGQFLMGRLPAAPRLLCHSAASLFDGAAVLVPTACFMNLSLRGRTAAVAWVRCRQIGAAAGRSNNAAPRSSLCVDPEQHELASRVQVIRHARQLPSSSQVCQQALGQHINTFRPWLARETAAKKPLSLTRFSSAVRLSTLCFVYRTRLQGTNAGPQARRRTTPAAFGWLGR